MEDGLCWVKYFQATRLFRHRISGAWLAYGVDEITPGVANREVHAVFPKRVSREV